MVDTLGARTVRDARDAEKDMVNTRKQERFKTDVTSKKPRVAGSTGKLPKKNFTKKGTKQRSKSSTTFNKQEQKQEQPEKVKDREKELQEPKVFILKRGPRITQDIILIFCPCLSEVRSIS